MYSILKPICKKWLLCCCGNERIKKYGLCLCIYDKVRCCLNYLAEMQ